MESVVAEQVDETLMLADLTSQASLENPHWTAEHQKLAKFNENKEVRKQQELVDVVGPGYLEAGSRLVWVLREAGCFSKDSC